MNELLNKHKLALIGVVIGIVGGYIYFYYWGCTRGCVITSSPVRSSLYGGLLGYLILSMFKSENKK